MALGGDILQARQQGGFQMLRGSSVLTEEIDDVPCESLQGWSGLGREYQCRHDTGGSEGDGQGEPDCRPFRSQSVTDPLCQNRSLLHGLFLFFHRLSRLISKRRTLSQSDRHRRTATERTHRYKFVAGLRGKLYAAIPEGARIRENAPLACNKSRSLAGLG
jgi:hypothetical protein